MAVLNVLVDRPCQHVWDVLGDGASYAEWVVGTQHIDDVDPDWPALGTKIHYSFGVGPWTMNDVTTVRLVEPGKRLELEVQAGPVGTARVAIELIPWGEERTVVILDEHPLSGLGARWHSIIVEGVLRLRNERMLRSLADLVRRRNPGAEPAADPV